MAGLEALFSMNSVKAYMEDKVAAYEDKIIAALQYEGEEFVKKARQIDTYTDRTGNLRASIGYVIMKGNQEVFSSFPGGTKEGLEAAKNLTTELGRGNEGYVLIGVAGMNYAAAVETLGYDVISGSAPADKDLKDLLSAIRI